MKKKIKPSEIKSEKKHSEYSAMKSPAWIKKHTHLDFNDPETECYCYFDDTNDGRIYRSLIITEHYDDDEECYLYDIEGIVEGSDLTKEEVVDIMMEKYDEYYDEYYGPMSRFSAK